MPQNPNPQAPALLLASIRPTAGNMLSLYYALKQLRGQSLAQNWGQYFPGGDNADDTIPDGSTVLPINYNALATLSVVDDFLVFIEDQNRLNLLLSVLRAG